MLRNPIIALLVGATLTVAACAQDAHAPSYPSQAPPRSVSLAPPTHAANQPVPSAQFAPGGSIPTGALTPPTDIAIGEIGPQPQPGGELVTVPDGDWRYAAPPPPETTPPVPETPDTEPIDGE